MASDASAPLLLRCLARWALRHALYLCQEVLHGQEQVTSPERLLEGTISAQDAGGLEEIQLSCLSPAGHRNHFGARGESP